MLRSGQCAKRTEASELSELLCHPTITLHTEGWGRVCTKPDCKATTCLTPISVCCGPSPAHLVMYVTVACCPGFRLPMCLVMSMELPYTDSAAPVTHDIHGVLFLAGVPLPAMMLFVQLDRRPGMPVSARECYAQARPQVPRTG